MRRLARTRVRPTCAPVVADSKRSLLVLAVAHGERVFEERGAGREIAIETRQLRRLE